MLVKDLMDEKKLDLNQPLLSVRRPPSSPRASSERYLEGDKRIGRSRFPVLRLPHRKSEMKSGPVRSPGVVPFLWEQTPGRPKEEMKPEEQRHDAMLPVATAAPKLPPGRNPGAGDRVDSQPAEDGEGDTDEEFVDALSRTGTSYLNCRMSDFSDSDDFDENQNRSFLTANRDMMMERFLPAAKALASETPKYAPRKQPPSQQVKKTPLTRARPALRYGLSFARRYSIFGMDAAAGGDEEEDENDDHHGFFPGGCGLLPRLLKGPVPGSSTRGSLSPANRTRPGSTSSGSLDNTTPKSTLKNVQAGKESEKDSDSGSLASERTVYVDTVQTVGDMHSFSTSSTNQIEVIETGEDGELQDFKLDSSKTDMAEVLERKDSGPETFENSPQEERHGHRPSPSQKSASDSTDSEKLLELPALDKASKKYSEFLAPPPLPKSPTDSWLFRTLPSVSSTKNASAKSFLAPATSTQNYH